MKLMQDELEDVRPALEAMTMLPKDGRASASIFGEAQGASFPFLVIDGELGDIPVFVITPTSSMPEMEDAKQRDMVSRMMGISDQDIGRYVEFMALTRKRYLGISSRSEYITSPEGTGHNFPYERPDFVVEQVHNMIDLVTARE